MTGSASIIRGDALALPLADDSVDLIVTSPPYFALRTYATDGGRDVGSEGDWHAYLDGLVAATAEMARVVKPTGSIFVDLGDKYASAASGQNGTGSTGITGGRHDRMGGRGRAPDDVPAKSLMLLPERYRIRCVDDLGLVCRSVIVWDKPNGLPESVTDRVKRSHEDWVHLTRRPRYYSAVDEIREPYRPESIARRGRGREHFYHPDGQAEHNGLREGHNPLGALPGSVWTIPTEPLKVPDYLRADDMEAGEGAPDHFAAFPTEWPRRLIQGFSPAGICTECDQGRRPVTTTEYVPSRNRGGSSAVARNRPLKSTATDSTAQRHGQIDSTIVDANRTITGYACGCDEPTAATRPAVVLDPFGGTGTTALVAKALGRHGITVDLSADYARLARWRTTDAHQIARVTGRHWTDRQGTLL